MRCYCLANNRDRKISEKNQGGSIMDGPFKDIRGSFYWCRVCKTSKEVKE